MRRAQYAVGLALLVAASLYLLPALRAADQPVPDSPEVSDLLAQAKTHGIRLRDDSDVMLRFMLSDMAWESHAAQVDLIKAHINTIGELLQKMDERREFASAWQQDAIDRITPLAAEVAASVEATIEHINQNQERLWTLEYQDYLTANFDSSSSLSATINNFVDYGKNRAKYQKLGTDLQAPTR